MIHSLDADPVGTDSALTGTVTVHAASALLALSLAVAFEYTASGMTGSNTGGANVGAVEKFLAQSSQSHGYRALRRLEAAGSGRHGWLDARTEFSVRGGLRYEVTAEGGSEYIRSRVLRGLLEEERRMIAKGNNAAALTPDNYTLTPEGTDTDGLDVVRLEPLRKEGSLVNGRMFLRPGDGELVRVEGTLAKNPSFWVTRVNIVRTYRRINGVLVPVLLESTAQLRMLGTSSLRMSYHYYEIDDRPTDAEASEVPSGDPSRRQS